MVENNLYKKAQFFWQIFLLQTLTPKTFWALTELESTEKSVPLSYASC